MRAGQFAPIVSGKFRTFAGGDVAVYAQDATDDGTLQNVFVERNRGTSIQLALAARARHAVTPDGITHILTLYDGERFEGVPGSAEFRIVRFAEHVIPVQVPALTDLVRKLEARPTAELLGSSDPKLRAELQWRLSMPLMCLVLTLLAVPLARLRPRQGRYARVWVAGLMFLLYSQLLTVGKVWIARDSAPAFLGLWWTHVVVVALALLVIFGPTLTNRLRYRRALPVSIIDRYIVRTILGSVLMVVCVLLMLGGPAHLHRPAGRHRHRSLHHPRARCGTRRSTCRCSPSRYCRSRRSSARSSGWARSRAGASSPWCGPPACRSRAWPASRSSPG